MKLIFQLPQFRYHKPYPINQRCIEFILMLYDSRIEADSYHDPPNTRIRAIQGHTYPGLKIERLYTEITTFDQYNKADLWKGARLPTRSSSCCPKMILTDGLGLESTLPPG